MHSLYLNRPNLQHLLLFRRLSCSYVSRTVSRKFSVASSPRHVTHNQDSVRRSYLYVPASSDRMLEKSLTTNSDIIIYDLEDSVSPNEKDNARLRLHNFLTVSRPQLEALVSQIRSMLISFISGETYQIPNELPSV